MRSSSRVEVVPGRGRSESWSSRDVVGAGFVGSRRRGWWWWSPCNVSLSWVVVGPSRRGRCPSWVARVVGHIVRRDPQQPSRRKATTTRSNKAETTTAKTTNIVEAAPAKTGRGSDSHQQQQPTTPTAANQHKTTNEQTGPRLLAHPNSTQKGRTRGTRFPPRTTHPNTNTHTRRHTHTLTQIHTRTHTHSAIRDAVCQWVHLPYLPSLITSTPSEENDAIQMAPVSARSQRVQPDTKVKNQARKRPNRPVK